MVALALWLLLVAAIGTVVVIGALRPAQKSGQRSSTVFTRRASRRASVPDGPVRSAAERNRHDRRPRRRAGPTAPAAPAPAPVQPPVVGPGVAQPTAGEREVTAEQSLPAELAVEATASGAHQDWAKTAPTTAEDSDPTVIDARTRWPDAAETDVAEHGDPRPADQSANEGLRRAE